MQEQQSIGAMLAAARHSAGLTVAQVSAATRIREAIIHCMEQDEYGQCGGDFYARGHVRAVARAVGLDPEATVHLYDQQYGIPQPVRASAVFQADRKIHLPERRGPNWTMALGVALAIVVVFGMMRVIGGASDQVRTGDVRAASARPSVPPNTPITEPPAPKPVVMTAQNTVTVRIRAKRSSYVNVHDASGNKLFAGTLKAGKTSTWKAADKVNVLLADAGAVSLHVNGKKVKGLGGRGEVVRRSFGPAKPKAR